MIRRQYGNCQLRQKHIGKEARNERGPHDPIGFFHGKPEFLRRVGDGLKADECPRRKCHHEENLSQRVALCREGRSKALQTSFMASHSRRKAQENAEQEKHCKRGLQHARQIFPSHAEQSDQNQRKNGQQRFSEINIISDHLVMEAHLKNVAQYLLGNQGKSRGIGPDDGNIGQAQEPCIKESMIIAKNLLGIGKRATRIGILVHHVLIILADDQHDNRTRKHAEQRAQRASRWQEKRPRHHKRAPAHTAAKRQCPNTQGR